MSLIDLQQASAGNLNIARAQALTGPSVHCVPGQLVAQSLLQFHYLLCELTYKKVIFSRFIEQFVFEILLTSDV